MSREMPFECAWCKKPSTYVLGKDETEPPNNLICDDCFEKGTEAQERDEQYADYYNEQQRIRYDGIHLFDNDVDRISVVFHRKQLRSWNYSGEGSNFFGQGKRDVMLTAKGYIEGWCDAVAAFKKKIQR